MFSSVARKHLIMQKVPIDQLQLGSYVTGVSRQSGDVVIKHAGWVRSEQLIDTLKAKGVLEVWVDPSQQLPPPKDLPAQTEAPQPQNPKPRTDFELEKNRASATLQNTKSQTAHTLQLLAQGEPADLQAPAQQCDKLLDSSLRNAQALLYLQQVLQEDDTLLRHSVRCACLMAALTASLKLPASQQRDYTLAALLHDAGKAQLRSLFPKELQTDLAALPYTLSLLQQSDATPEMLAMIETHLAPLAAQSDAGRLLAIVNSYANLQELADSGKISQSALQPQLMRACDHTLDPLLTQQFLQTLGLYPPGTAVRLKSGRLALVLENHPKLADKPKVKQFYHSIHRHHLPAKVLELAKLPEETIVGPADLAQFALDLRQYF